MVGFGRAIVFSCVLVYVLEDFDHKIEVLKHLDSVAHSHFHGIAIFMGTAPINGHPIILETHHRKSFVANGSPDTASFRILFYANASGRNASIRVCSNSGRILFHDVVALSSRDTCHPSHSGDLAISDNISASYGCCWVRLLTAVWEAVVGDVTGDPETLVFHDSEGKLVPLLPMSLPKETIAKALSWNLLELVKRFHPEGSHCVDMVGLGWLRLAEFNVLMGNRVQAINYGNRSHHMLRDPDLRMRSAYLMLETCNVLNPRVADDCARQAHILVMGIEGFMFGSRQKLVPQQIQQLLPQAWSFLSMYHTSKGQYKDASICMTNALNATSYVPNQAKRNILLRIYLALRAKLALHEAAPGFCNRASELVEGALNVRADTHLTEYYALLRKGEVEERCGKLQTALYLYKQASVRCQSKYAIPFCDILRGRAEETKRALEIQMRDSDNSGGEAQPLKRPIYPMWNSVYPFYPSCKILA